MFVLSHLNQIVYCIVTLVDTIGHAVRVNVSGGTFQKNKYMDSPVVIAYNNVGPKMCIKDCMLYKECNGINYLRDTLSCELLQISYPGDQTITRIGSHFTEIDNWKKVDIIQKLYIKTFKKQQQRMDQFKETSTARTFKTTKDTCNSKFLDILFLNFNFLVFKFLKFTAREYLQINFNSKCP